MSITAIHNSDCARHNEPASPNGPCDCTLAAFAQAITEACMKHGFGIEGGVVYIMEPDDFAFSYAVDDESRLVRP